jgi:hypothetical protein
MTFIREIGLSNITDEVVQEFTELGCEIRWKDDSIEIWVKKGE